MFAGMIAPEKPPLRIAWRTSSRVSLRTLKFGPSVRSPLLIWPGVFEPNASAASSEWQPLQRSLKSIAPWCTLAGSFFETLTLWSPQPVASAAEAARQAASKRRGPGMGAHIIRRHAQAPSRRAARGRAARGVLERRRQEEERGRDEQGHGHRRSQPAD